MYLMIKLMTEKFKTHFTTLIEKLILFKNNLIKENDALLDLCLDLNYYRHSLSSPLCLSIQIVKNKQINIDNLLEIESFINTTIINTGMSKFLAGHRLPISRNIERILNIQDFRNNRDLIFKNSKFELERSIILKNRSNTSFLLKSKEHLFSDIIELIQEEIINQLYFEINVIRKGLKDKIKVLIEDKPLSFSFNGNIDKLKNTLKQLQLNIDLLNNDSKIDYLFEVFTTDDLSNYYDEIVIGCDTKQFAYVLKSLHFYFNNLTMKSIEDCRLFKSKNNTIILANNLYSKGQMTPKKSADIDKAINLMK